MYVATRRAQMVWPMMTVTVTNFEGFTRQQFRKICKNVHFRSFSSEIHILHVFIAARFLVACVHGGLASYLIFMCYKQVVPLFMFNNVVLLFVQ